MKNKQIVFLIGIILVVTTLPVSGFTIDINEKNVVLTRIYHEDFPGFMTLPYPKLIFPKISQIDFKHPKIMSFSLDAIIVDMILKLDESMVLQYLEDITSFGPRLTGTSECYEAGEYIYNEFESMGLEVRFHDWSYGGYEDRNIEATLNGVNSSSDEIYVICAHFDSFSESPGADDDGSGIAAVLSAAYLISQYDVNYTIRFVAFSGEEQGLLGSYKYVQEAFGNGDNIVGALNADMIGYAETKQGGINLTIRQNSYSIWLTDFIENVNQLYHEYINLEIKPEDNPFGYSDHYNFWQFGYYAIQFREFETNPFYHTPDDTIQNMNITYSAKCSKLFLATLAELAQPHETNIPPNPVVINGPANGKPGTSYNYTFNTIDPNDDDVYYYIKWGDGYIENWNGPHSSGEDFEIAHTYANQGTFTIQAKAKDIYDCESNWSEFEVVIPRNKISTNSLFYWFLDRFPMLERLFELIKVS